MADKVDCLFSLELVVDKLYLPHVVCRFPALAFRLLDFPTIVIHHVEEELADNIKRKIRAEPDYQVPSQFTELKDKHGNFMIQKGKSCLFKISLESLRVHLTSTPLYVMVIDSFTDVPKLLGNSTVPLDKIIENISNDVAKVGNSIPSVHGDKGLFKIYNLMGKEVGYVVLGYRILSVGPSLVPHLSDQVITHIKDKQTEEITKLDTKPTDKLEIDNDYRPASRNAGTLTVPTKLRESLTQTSEYETEDKSIHVDIPGNEKYATERKTVHSISTQTSSRQKNRPHPPEKLLLTNENDDNDIIVTNVSRPPPLFYTGRKDTKVLWINRNTESPDINDSNFEDYSDIVSLPGDSTAASTQEKSSDPIDAKPTISKNSIHSNSHVHTVGTAHKSLTNNNMFPFLSALLQELSCLQMPQGTSTDLETQQQLVQNGLPYLEMLSMNRDHIVNVKPGHTNQFAQKTVQTSKRAVPALKLEHADSGDHRHSDIAPSPEHKCGRLSHRSCAGDHQGVPKNKSWLRKTPEYAVKKSKLTFGLTNTHRLRLAKANPEALQHERRAASPTPLRETPQEEFEEGNLSDMSTEIRRHTLDDMEEAVRDNAPSSVEDNTQQRQSVDADKSLRVSFSESVEKFTSPTRRRKKTKHRQSSPSVKKGRKSTPSPQPRAKLQIKPTAQPDLKVNITTSNSNEDNNQIADTGTGTEDTPRVSKETESSGEALVPMMPDLPQYVPYEPDSSDSEEQQESLSYRSGKSIEVRLPSAEPQSGEESNASSPERPENGASKMSKLGSFAGFPKDADDYWDSLKASKLADDKSEDDMGDFSYIPSWGVNSSIDKHNMSSAVFSSTGDFDSRQFRSTEEPELLDLLNNSESESLSSNHSAQAAVSEDASGKTKSSDKGSVSTVLRIPVLNPLLSETSPVPSTRRSIARAELSTAPNTEPVDASASSSKRPTPRPSSRKRRDLEKRESINTESISTYVPSDADNINTSVASDPTYSEDFHNLGSDEDDSISPIPKFIPTTKLGYTIS